MIYLRVAYLNVYVWLQRSWRLTRGLDCAQGVSTNEEICSGRSTHMRGPSRRCLFVKERQ